MFECWACSRIKCFFTLGVTGFLEILTEHTKHRKIWTSNRNWLDWYKGRTDPDISIIKYKKQIRTVGVRSNCSQIENNFRIVNFSSNSLKDENLRFSSMNFLTWIRYIQVDFLHRIRTYRNKSSVKLMISSLPPSERSNFLSKWKFSKFVISNRSS